MDSKFRGKQIVYDQIVWEGDSWDEGMNIVAEAKCWLKKNLTKSKGGDRVQSLSCRQKGSCELKGRLREDVNSNEITLETCGVCSCVVDGVDATLVQHGLPNPTKDFLQGLFDANYTTVGKAMDRMRQLQKKGELPIDMPQKPNPNSNLTPTPTPNPNPNSNSNPNPNSNSNSNLNPNPNSYFNS